MYKVFTVNKNGKIELTKEELQKLLDDSYWEGYRANTGTYVYTSPTWRPWTWTITTCDSSNVTPLSTSTTAASDSITYGTSACDGGVTLTADQVAFSLNDFATAYAAGEIKNEI